MRRAAHVVAMAMLPVPPHQLLRQPSLPSTHNEVAREALPQARDSIAPHCDALGAGGHLGAQDGYIRHPRAVALQMGVEARSMGWHVFCFQGFLRGFSVFKGFYEGFLFSRVFTRVFCFQGFL